MRVKKILCMRGIYVFSLIFSSLFAGAMHGGKAI